MTQYLPPDDSFEESTGAITGYPSLWYRLTPWESILAHGAWDWGSWSYSNLELYDRYFSKAIPRDGLVGGYKTAGKMPVGYDEYVARSCVNAFPAALTGSAASAMHGGSAFRNAEAENVVVKASFYTLHTAPFGSNTNLLGSQAIGARIQNGISYGSSPDDHRVTYGDGYWFGIFMSNMATSSPPTNFSSCDFQLFRVINGVATLLASEVYDSSGGTSLYTKAVLREGAPFTLKIIVNTNPSVVQIRCYHVPTHSVGPFVAGDSRLAISYNDASANRILGPGRAGIMQASEYDSGSGIAVPCCGWIQMVDKDLGDLLLFRDEWKRTYTEEAHKVTSDVAASTLATDTFGYSLQSAYINDTYGYHRESYIFDRSLPVTSADGLEFDFDIINVKDSTSCGAVCISSRPADDAVNQDRSVEFYFDSTGNASNLNAPDDELFQPTVDGTRSAGIVLRSSGYTRTSWQYPEPLNGYACSFQRVDYDGSTKISVYTYDPIHWRRTIAESSGVITLSMDTWYTARMKIRNVPGPGGTISDAVEIKVYLDTVQQSFTSSYAGVVVDASGTIFDERSDRVLSGSGEGIRINTADNTAIGSPRKTYVDNWAQGAGSGPDVESENDQASITVGREDDGASGTLVLNAGWPVDVASTYGNREHRFEYREYRYANAAMTKPRRVWTIGAKAITEAETDALLVFWNEHHGTQRGFSWVTDEGEAVTVHFMEDELVTALRAPGVTRFSIVLEELFDGA